MALFNSPATANEPVSQVSFSGKVIVVTGGSDGIGKALVEFFLTAGAKVATCGRNHDKLYALQAAHSGKPLVIHVADVSKEIECQLFIEKVVQQFGGIDVLINNAGISMRSLFQDLQLETLHKVMDINFWGNGVLFQICFASFAKKRWLHCGCLFYCRLPRFTGKDGLFSF
jgi:NAD(P)-dependent dehydrogenase (short-subunit alcohol dehydrogenase family)